MACGAADHAPPLADEPGSVELEAPDVVRAGSPAVDATAATAPAEQQAVCGNGLLEGSEVCDSGAGGCDAACVDKDYFSSYDHVIRELMEKHRVPGGAVAVTRHGRLVHTAGYGFADNVDGLLSTPNSLFRIASMSKLLTAVGVLSLVDSGQLDLDAPALDYLPSSSSAHAPMDTRFEEVTVRQLLQHSGGWDRERTFDPMFRSTEIADSLGMPGPSTPRMVFDYMYQRPLDFEPGQRFAYSNFGYALLGEVIATASGERYEDYVQKHVLRPAGASNMHIGHTRLDQRLPGEARYQSSTMTPSVFPDDPELVPAPYGGWHQESLAAHGGWVGNVLDLSRVLVALKSGELLSESSMQQLTRAPEFSSLTSNPDEGSWYSMGLNVRSTDVGQNWWHSGQLHGSTGMFVVTDNEFTWVALFNGGHTDDSFSGDAFLDDLDSGLWRAWRQIERWPEQDLFNLPED